MSDRLIQIFLIDDDAIFRLGLRTALAAFPDLHIFAEADTAAIALDILSEADNAIDLIILELSIERFNPNPSDLTLCQQLKAYSIPILLLTAESEAERLMAAKASGIEGYCAKGADISLIVQAIRQVMRSEFYWQPNLSVPITAVSPSWQHKMRFYGIRQIEDALAQVNQELQNPHLSTLGWLFCSGHRRELLAARWVVNQLLPTNVIIVETDLRDREKDAPSRLSSNRVSRQLPAASLTKFPLSQVAQPATPLEVTLAKLDVSLANLTNIVLEIDILQTEKKRDLLYIVLQKFAEILEELRFSQVTLEQLPQKRSQILQDLWQTAITEFFGKYYTLAVENDQFEVVKVMLDSAVIVQEAILEKIPLVGELLAHQLFQTPLMIDNVSYPAQTPEALARGEMLIQNLMIQVANAVVQPLLNEFADLEPIKQSFYDRSLISTREITRFRNNLSWRYRVFQLLLEPREIFESRYSLFILSDTGIKQTSIYAPRRQELEQLRGIPLVVTLAYEARDAIAPRLRGTVAWIGRGLVYVLTSVLGRSIGLVVRGVIQGVGSSLQDTRFGKNNEREK